MSNETSDVVRSVEEEFGESSNRPTAAAAVAPNEATLPEIFKLNVDCFEELLVWLSLKDLFVLRQTCKPFKKRVDDFIKQFFPGIRLGYSKVFVGYQSIELFRYLDDDCCKLIKHMQLELYVPKLDHIKNILTHIEVLEMENINYFECDFYDILLKFCTKLKSFTIHSIEPESLMDKNGQWLRQQYPMLERFVLDDFFIDGYYSEAEIPQLKTFFQINPNIRNFGMSLSFLWANRGWIRNADLHFDQLEIDERFLDTDEEETNERFGLLRDLHGQGFYKRLHLYVNRIVEYYMTPINSLPGLEKVYFDDISTDDDIDDVSTDIQVIVPLSVKELSFSDGSEIKNAETLAQNMPSVEQMYIRKATSTDILPFIRFSPNLKVSSWKMEFILRIISSI